MLPKVHTRTLIPFPCACCCSQPCQTVVTCYSSAHKHLPLPSSWQLERHLYLTLTRSCVAASSCSSGA
jgi:hypothetical protein